MTTGVSGSKQYYAYGATRTGSVPTDWQFTGQETDSTGLVYLHARYYDPATGQFLSPDTVVLEPAPRPESPQFTSPPVHQSTSSPVHPSPRSLAI